MNYKVGQIVYLRNSGLPGYIHRLLTEGRWEVVFNGAYVPVSKKYLTPEPLEPKHPKQERVGHSPFQYGNLVCRIEDGCFGVIVKIWRYGKQRRYKVAGVAIEFDARAEELEILAHGNAFRLKPPHLGTPTAKTSCVEDVPPSPGTLCNPTENFAA